MVNDQTVQALQGLTFGGSGDGIGIGLALLQARSQAATQAQVRSQTRDTVPIAFEQMHSILTRHSCRKGSSAQLCDTLLVQAPQGVFSMDLPGRPGFPPLAHHQPPLMHPSNLSGELPVTVAAWDDPTSAKQI